MTQKLNANYIKGIVICHGKSEWQMVRYITSNLHLNVKPFARHKGKTSTQITGLMDILNAQPFLEMEAFLKEYPVDVIGKGKKQKLGSFRLFVIMDTDDCTPEQRHAYITGQMFCGHWLKDYITPIYCDPCLEKVMENCGILTRRINSNEKGRFYEEIFPINEKPFSYDSLQEVQTFQGKIDSCKNTNLNVLINYCLYLLQER